MHYLLVAVHILHDYCVTFGMDSAIRIIYLAVQSSSKYLEENVLGIYFNYFQFIP